MMNKLTQKIIFSFSIVLSVLFFAVPSFAIADTVEFSQTPLFGNSGNMETNFAPGNSISGRYIKINNSTADSHRAIISAFDVINSGGLGNVTNLKIKDGGTVLYNDNFSNFFSKQEIILSQIPAGESRTFDLIVNFGESAGNTYQNSQMKFGIKTGLDDGDTSTDTTVIGGGGGSGGSSNSGSTVLTIWNEQALNITNVNNSGSATITWNTNLPATSQVVYGLSSKFPYVLDLQALNFGYTFSTAEDATNTLNHSMLLAELIPGQTYLYRVVSHISLPPTVSYEHQFTVPLPAQIDNNIFTALNNQNPNQVQGAVLGASTENVPENIPDDKGKVEGAFTNNLAASVASIISNILPSCYMIALLIILLLYLIWRFFLKKRYEKIGMLKEEIVNRFYIFFSISSLLVIIILLIVGYHCPIPIFIILSIISTGFFAFRKLRIK